MNSRLLLLAMPVACLLSGCGDGRPERFPVSGRVLIDGVPLDHGFVQVLPDNGRAAIGQLGPDGRFQLTTFDAYDGCIAGTHKVAVIAVETIDARSQRWHAPKEYMDPATSGLTINVTTQTTSAELELTWDGGEPFVERFDEE